MKERWNLDVIYKDFDDPSFASDLQGYLTSTVPVEYDGKTIVTLLPDTGERYLSTPLYHK